MHMAHDNALSYLKGSSGQGTCEQSIAMELMNWLCGVQAKLAA